MPALFVSTIFISKRNLFLSSKTIEYVRILVFINRTNFMLSLAEKQFMTSGLELCPEEDFFRDKATSKDLNLWMHLLFLQMSSLLLDNWVHVSSEGTDQTECIGILIRAYTWKSVFSWHSLCFIMFRFFCIFPLGCGESFIFLEQWVYPELNQWQCNYHPAYNFPSIV